MQGNLKQALEYAAKNPTSPFATEFARTVKSGAVDQQAQELGIDLTPIKNSSLGGAVAPKPVAPVAEVTEKRGVVSQEQAQQNRQDIVGFGKGFLKGAGETLQNIGKGAIEVATLGKADTSKLGISEETLEAKTGAEKFGKGAERFAEFFIPASKIAKAENAVDVLIKGKDLLSSAGRVLAKGGAEALTTGAIRTAQTGDIKEGAKAGLTAGGLRGGLAVIGEGARALRLPERLYSTIFKNTYDDVISDFKSGTIAELQKTNPARFDDLVKKGIIKVKDGTPALDETLAKEALDRGLRGSIKGMAKTVVDKTLELEDEARTLANQSTKRINFKEGQFTNVLNKIKSDYADVGLGEMADEADDFLKALSDGAGTLSASDTLKFKRFLDGMRIRSSFQAVQPSQLSQTQQNFKTLADLARGRLKESVPEMTRVMDDYRFYIEALDSLAGEAKRRGNSQVISLIDSMFLSGGLAGGQALPTAIGLGIRNFLKSAKGATALAQAIQNPQTRPLGELLRALSGAGVSEATKED